MVYVLALAAAALFGTGSAVQQRVAATAPAGTTLHFALLWYLIRQPVWLIGVGTALVGNLLSGAALTMGGVSLVQPLLVTRLLFALPISAALTRQRLQPRDWSAAVAVVAGMTAFLVIGDPRPGPDTNPPMWRWALAAGTIGLLTAVLVALARRLRPLLEAPVLGAGAGMLYGLQAGLTQAALRRLVDDGILAMLLSWLVYAVAAAAILGTLLAQSAYKLEPLPASYPPMASTEPLTGIAIGVGVLSGTLRLTPLAFGGAVIGLAVMTVGIYLLASSPLVSGVHHKRDHRAHRSSRRR